MSACGVFRYALFGGPKLWDVAAGVLLVKEAGGLAFTMSCEKKDWQLLEQFQIEPDDSSGSLENLRRWSFPIVAGAPEAAREVVKDIRIPHRPSSRRRRRLWSTGR
jgi:fructose-1,6-bisphosphatase/inositol monophosphatase family enzyme